MHLEHTTQIGVYPNADGSVTVIYPSRETTSGVRRKVFCADAWAVLREHYEAIAEQQQCD